MSKCIIKYEYENYWYYFIGIMNTKIYSILNSESREIAVMGLTHARENVKEITNFYKKRGSSITKIRIINIETNETMSNEDIEISRFELMEID